MKKYLIIIILFFVAELYPQNVTNRWGFGAELGAMNGTIDAGYFAMGFNVDYIMAENFSIAEVVTFIPSGDLSQINLNTVARFNIPTLYFTFIPYLGLGFSYGKIEKEFDDTAFSLGFPIGLSLLYPLADQISASVRTQVTIYNMDYGSFGKDSNYFEIMFGFRFSP